MRTDKPEAELYLYEAGKQQAEKKWQAHRELSAQLHQSIDDICKQAACEPQDLQGVVVYKGPGSYTGVRIGVSTANALGYAYQLRTVGTSGDDWKREGLKLLNNVKYFIPVTPSYGSAARTTLPKK